MSFEESMLGLTPAKAVAESSRCLRCDVHEPCAVKE
jgi:NADPH-dependent glutamate synthase beta subunit-like oxidoreductase